MRKTIWSYIKIQVNDDNETGFALFKAGFLFLGFNWWTVKEGIIHSVHSAIIIALLSITGYMMVTNIPTAEERKSEDGLILLIKILVPLFSLVFSTIKLVVMHIFNARIRSVIDYADKLGRQENRRYRTFSKLNKISKCFSVGVGVTVLGIIASGMAETGLPVPVYWPYSKTGTLFYVACACFCLVTISVGVIHVTADVLLSHLIEHVVCQANKMKRYLAKVGHEEREDRILLENSWRTHKNILSLVDKIRRCYSVFILMQGAYTIAHSSVVIFAVVKVSYLPFILGHAVPMMLTAYIQLLVYSHAGEALKTEMEKVAFQVYDNGWYQRDLKIRKFVYLMLLVCNRPVELHSFRMFTANFATYLTNVRESFSYFIALRKLTSNI